MTALKEMKCHFTPKRIMLTWARLIRVCLVAGSALVGVMIHTSYNGNHRETTSPPLHVSRKNPETDEGAWPRIAWLMSFPNSGTSFTIKMVRRLSHLSTATNYGDEYLQNGESVPVHANSFSSSPPHPPFWADPQAGFAFERPRELAFTKTHCGGYRADSPREELMDEQVFLKKCLSGRGVLKTNGESRKIPSSQYSVELVQRAVHLIRNPFDNVVSRFHLQLKRFAKHNETKKLNSYPKSREGFHKFCHDDNLVYPSDHPGLMDSNTWSSLLRDVPCGDDFVRYVQWHNMAFATTKRLGLPTLTLHYENYETKYNETATEILNFLQLERKGDMKEFIQGKEYAEYFSMEERENVKQAMERIALPVTWENIKHYFE